MAYGAWAVFVAQAFSIIFSAQRWARGSTFGRPRGREGAASLSDRREYDRIDGEKGRVSKSSAPFCRRRPGHPDVLYNCVQSENTGLTMSQQKPNGLLSLGRWTAKA